MMSPMTPVSRAESAKIPGSSRQPSSRYQSGGTTSAYTTATAAASVGVNSPSRMPPMMISGIMSPGNAWRRASVNAASVGGGSRG